MGLEHKILYKGGEGEIVEKKSRFIATTLPVATEEEALAFIESVRKRYWDARHHCFAYVIGDRGELARCSDDGEPQGTAGKPMLEALTGAGVHNAAVVVTRYFGGTLLGTGGLVRAYTAAVKAGLSASVIITGMQGMELEIRTDYTGLGKIRHILGRREIPVMDCEYTDAVRLFVLLGDDERESVEAEITEGTNGQAELKEIRECRFAQIDGRPVILE